MSELAYSALAGNEHTLDHRATEYAVLDQAGNGVELRAERERVVDRAEVSIHQEVRVVGALLTRVDCDGAQVAHPGGDDSGREVEDLEWCAERAESVHELGLVDHDDEPRAHLGDQLLPRLSTAAALGEVEVGVDLVRAVDGDVESPDVVGRDDLHPERRGELVGTDGGGRADDLQAHLAERLDRMGHGRSGSQADPHAIGDQSRRLSPCRFLGLVLGHRHGGQRIAGLAAAATVVLVSMSGALGVRPAHAHGGDPFVHAEVDEVGVEGLLVGVVPGEIAQVVMANETGALVEVLDDDGVAFIRFSEASVEVDVASAAWLRTLDPAGGDRHGAAPDCSGECWRTLADSPVFAWSDHRLHPAVRDVPQDLFGSSQDVVLAEWEIPVRADGDRSSVTGEIVYRPAEGFAVAGLASGPAPGGVAATIEPGRVPAVDIEPTGDSVFVRDAAGDAFVRVGEGEVAFHTGTRMWHDLADLAGLELSTEPTVGGGDLAVVATGKRFAWLDPRGAYLDDTGPDEPSVVVQWSIPYVAGVGDGRIVGQTQWIPTPDRVPAADGDGVPLWAILVAAAGTAVLVVLLVRRRHTSSD